MNSPHISVVIPVYRAEGCLSELYSRLKDSLETISKDFEIIMVEDCGGDRSWEIIKELSGRDIRVKGIRFSRNFGQHYGITAGLDYARGEWIVVMDCDLQDRPEEIPKLYAKAMEGCDVVLARRDVRKDAILRRLSSKIFYRIFNWLADTDHDGQTANFRIISRRVVENFRMMRELLRSFPGLVDWMGFPTVSVTVEHGRRSSGESSYTFGKLWNLAVDVIIAYSDKPLRLAIKIGFAMTFFSFVLGGYFLYKTLVYGSIVTGWASLIVSLYFLGGVIIGILGIIGIYLGKTFDETKKRPLYIIKETKNVRTPD